MPLLNAASPHASGNRRLAAGAAYAPWNFCSMSMRRRNSSAKNCASLAAMRSSPESGAAVWSVSSGRAASGGKCIGMRADMDALPMTNAPGSLMVADAGRMHAADMTATRRCCWARPSHLCETRNFDGTVGCIFQPAEEGGAGARAMMDDGLMERFGIDQVFGLHNEPGLAVGQFAIRTGAFPRPPMTRLLITDKRAAAVMPPCRTQTIDPILHRGADHLRPAGHRARATPIRSRRSSSSITKFHAGDADECDTANGRARRHGAHAGKGIAGKCRDPASARRRWKMSPARWAAKRLPCLCPQIPGDRQ